MKVATTAAVTATRPAVAMVTTPRQPMPPAAKAMRRPPTTRAHRTAPMATHRPPTTAATAHPPAARPARVARARAEAARGGRGKRTAACLALLQPHPPARNLSRYHIRTVD